CRRSSPPIAVTRSPRATTRSSACGICRVCPIAGVARGVQTEPADLRGHQPRGDLHRALIYRGESWAAEASIVQGFMLLAEQASGACWRRQGILDSAVGTDQEGKGSKAPIV